MEELANNKSYKEQLFKLREFKNHTLNLRNEFKNKIQNTETEMKRFGIDPEKSEEFEKQSKEFEEREEENFKKIMQAITEEEEKLEALIKNEEDL